jgi:aspartate/methionine/tyrosine aminotransferase
MRENCLLGGGVSFSLREGRTAGLVESRHLVLRRIMRSRAALENREFLDLGSDFTYPCFDDYGPTSAALEAATGAVATARSYPSSYGLTELREEFSSLMRRLFDTEVDSATEMAVTFGATQAFDALSRSYAGRVVMLPRLSLSTVESVSIGNGATVMRIPLDDDWRMDLDALEKAVELHVDHGIRFVYFNSPNNPTGVVYPRQYLKRLIDIARASRTLLVHDHDSWFTSHTAERSVNILEVPGAKDIAVTVLSISKELGLPGLRIAAVMGCPEVVNTVRIHNSHFGVMIPELCQRGAAAALRQFRDDAARRRVQREIQEALTVAVRGLRELGWPDDAILTPEAGYKFIFKPPASFSSLGDPSGVELFDFLVARDAAVKFSTSRSFDPTDQGWMRMIMMQKPSGMAEVFRRLAQIGIHYRMAFPDGLEADYATVIAGQDFADL